MQQSGDDFVSGSLFLKLNSNVAVKPIYSKTTKILLPKTLARILIGICNGKLTSVPEFI
jgi:hypothetical protein